MFKILLAMFGLLFFMSCATIVETREGETKESVRYHRL